MCRSATLAIAVSSTCMKVAIDTTQAISHGLRSPAAERLASHSAAGRVAHRTFTVGTTDMPGPSWTSGGWSKVIFTGTRCTTFT